MDAKQSGEEEKVIGREKSQHCDEGHTKEDILGGDLATDVAPICSGTLLGKEVKANVTKKASDEHEKAGKRENNEINDESP